MAFTTLKKAFCRAACVGLATLGISLATMFNGRAQPPVASGNATHGIVHFPTAMLHQVPPARVSYFGAPPVAVPLWQTADFPFTASVQASSFLTTVSLERNRHVLFATIFRPYAHLRTEVGAGYGYRIPLGKPGHHGAFYYEPSLAFVVREDRAWADMQALTSGIYYAPYQLQGVGGDFCNRLSWEAPNERLSLFIENSLAMYTGGAAYLDSRGPLHPLEMWNLMGVSFRVSPPAAKHPLPRF